MIDFKLKTEGEQEEIYSKNGYVIEMSEASGGELPTISDDPAILYNQTMAIFGTINQGQLRDNPSFGTNYDTKRGMYYADISKEMYQYNLLEELAEMITELFFDNEEMLDYCSETISVVAIDPTL